jgi:hypothetical protein
LLAANPHKEAASWDVYQNGDMEKPTRRMFEFLLYERCRSGNHLVSNVCFPLIESVGGGRGREFGLLFDIFSSDGL